MKRRRVAFLAVALLFDAAGCRGVFKTPIKDILDNPAAYEGKVVKVEGSVADSANILIVKYYHLADATGRIVVVARTAVPMRGAQVAVRGTVHQAFALGDQSLTVIFEEP